MNWGGKILSIEFIHFNFNATETMESNDQFERQLWVLKRLLEEVREINRSIKEFEPPQREATRQEPAYGDCHWVMAQLGISRATYYNHVRGKLLRPLLRVGNREYFAREEVRALLERKAEGMAYSHMTEAA